ncbi:hypothetical protein [Bacillus pumilus]|uniref:hypothetical protein n=1 Tax=Bacillus pumilus TaxID=1408 RepID=UPI00119CDB90|nr:hypothetical protein [Bacillus pumilus]
MTNINFYDFISLIGKKVWGFNPNRDVKPVHFANGLYRSVCGGHNNIQLIQTAAAGYIKGSSKVSNKQFLSDMRNAYSVDEEEKHDLLDKVGNLRSALDLLLTQDKGLYANFDSSATLSHFLLTSNDPSDRGTGNFLTEILSNSEDKSIITTLRETLIDERDNVYLLASPLLERKELGTEPFISNTIAEIMKNSPHLYKIQEAFLNLNKYRRKLEKTVYLQRIVTLGCFAIFLHLTNRTINIENIEEVEFSPIFLASSDPTREIREVSRASFARGRQKIEIGYEEGLKGEIEKRWGTDLSKEEYIEIIKELLPGIDLTSEEINQDTQVWYRFIEDFEGNIMGTSNITDAFTKAFVRTAFSFYNKSNSNKSNPESVNAFIGRNIGLVYPREGGPGDKYYLPGPRFLDTLVVSLLDPTEEISIDEFWDRAWEKFGIVTGARGTKDIQRLLNWGIRQVSPKQASQNAKIITSELSRMGYVTEYADDIAMIRGGGVTNE